MKSVKPGRGPSGMNFLGSLFGIVFGIVWTAVAISIGAPFFFPLFGVAFIGLGVAQAVYHYHNATGENRYSAFDITEDGEEPDPLDARFAQSRTQPPPKAGGRFCPYCGTPAAQDHTFCRNCGKKLG